MPDTMITVLTSGNSLGAYVPGVRLSQILEQQGVACSVEVLETLFPDEVRMNMIKTKALFHQSFQAALMGHRLAKDIGPVFDPVRESELLQRWVKEHRTRFVAITGFWIPVLEKYSCLISDPIDVQFVRLDAVDTPSYLAYQDRYGKYSHQWLFQKEDEQYKLHMRLNMLDSPIIAWHERDNRIMVHGGGWGIGTYQQTIQPLQAHYKLDLVAYTPHEQSHARSQDTLYWLEAEWHPWTNPLRSERTTFPPMSHNRQSTLEQDSSLTIPTISQAAASSIAIVSKPGGGTLIDSLSGATPLIYLEPFGEHERHNAACWRALGFALSYEEWRQSGFDPSILEELHLNLLEHINLIPNYGEDYACNLKAMQR